jgi:hypothetical protein
MIGRSTVCYFVCMLHCKTLSILAFMALLAMGCRKDKDEEAPRVEIITPGSAHTLGIPDTLLVVARVSDDHMVRNVHISITDELGVPIAAPASAQVNAPSALVERTLVVHNEQVATGTYILTVRADDGSRSASAFRTVNVLGTPLRLRAVYVLPSGTGPVAKIDSTGAVSTFLPAAEIGEAAVNSFSQQLFLAGGSFSPLQVIPLNTSASSWQLPHQNAQSGTYFLDVTTDPFDQRTYVSSNDGLIRGFRGGTTTLFAAQAMESHRPHAMVVLGNLLVSEQRALGQNSARLVNHAYTSGAMLGFHPLDVQVVRMFRHSSQQVMVFGVRGGEGVIQLRNAEQGGNFEMRVFSEGPITAATRVAEYRYVLALPQRVVLFNYQNNSVTTLLEAAASDVAFDAANGSVIVGVQDQVRILDPNTGAVTGTIQVPMQVGRVLPLLNR